MSKFGRSHAFVTLLGFMLSLIQLPMPAQGGGAQITSEQVNQAIGEIQKLCENEIKQGAVPGLALAVVYQDKVVYAAGFGLRDVNTQEPINADTVFQLASLSKPIGSTLVAELVGEGKISWDSKISELDPDFEMYDPWVTREITIRDFYSHRSGLPDHAGDLLEDLGFSREEILHLLRYQKPDSSFRSHYAYTNGWNVGYDTEGRLRLGHSGAFALGAATTVQLIPSEHLGIVVLTDAYPIGLAEGVAFTFTDFALYGKSRQDWLALFKQMFSNPAALGMPPLTDYSKPPALPTPALANSAYIGTYTNNFFGDIQIIGKGQELAIVEGLHKMTFPMKHYDRDTFTYKPEGENAEGASGVTFTIGPEGKAATVVVENLNVRADGTFKRESAADAR
jgi:CubicO group peptidase (beta-lactamase class C family)